MKRIVSIGSIIVVITVLALVAGPGFVDWNKYKPQIIAQLNNATGHDYELGGNLELALIPSPRLKLEQLKVSMPATAGGQMILSLEKASVQVDLVPLFSREISVNSVELVKPAFNIGINADGTPSWMTASLKEKMNATASDGKTTTDAGAGIAGAIALNKITVKEGAFTFSDARQEVAPLAINNIDLTLKADSLNGPFEAAGSFSYKDQTIKTTLKSGRLTPATETEAQSIPLQADLELPATQANASFAGVVTLKPVLELQGEAGISAVRLDETLEALTGAAQPPALNQALAAKGLLTYGPKSIDFKNMTLNLGGMEGTGGLTIVNLKSSAQTPMDINLTLKADKPVDLDGFLPAAPPSEKGDSSRSGVTAKSKTFLPESFVLPANLKFKADISASAAEYKGAVFGKATLIIQKNGNDIGGTATADAPGQGKIDNDFKLSFASVSASGRTGQAIHADPKLTLDGTFTAAVPQALAESFLKKDQIKSMGNLLAAPVSLAYKTEITPRRINLSGGSVKALDTDLALGGSYTLGAKGGRDLLAIQVSADTFDADAWLKRLDPQSKAATDAAIAGQTKSSAKLDVAGIAKKLSLPVDLDLAATIGRVRLNEQDYDKLGVQGRLVGNKLTIDKFDLTAEGGNTLGISGTVADVTALKDVDLSINGKTPDFDKLAQGSTFNTKSLPKNIGAVEVLGEFKGQPERLAFVANVKAMRGTLETSGTLSDVMQAPKFSALTVRLKHPNYVDLVKIWQPNFKASVTIQKNIDVFASMTLDDKIYKFTDLQATIGPSVISGNMTYDTGAVRPKLMASLQAGDLPLSDLLGHESQKKGAIRAQGNTANPGSDVRWSRNAINVDWMRNYDATVKASVKSLIYGPWRMDNAVLNTTLSNGVLEVTQLDTGLYGGRMAATAKVTAPADAKQPLAVTAVTKMSNVSVESFVDAFSGGGRLIKARGTINLDSNIETTGISPAALVYGLRGKGTTDGEKLVFDGFDLARLSRTLAQPSSSMKENLAGILDASMAGGQTSFDTLDGAFTITEGVINLDKMNLIGPAASVALAGKINLPLWMLDVEATIGLTEPKDAPPLKTSFRGPLDNPGKTFGRSALDSYIGQRIGKVLEEAIIEKLQDKKILPGILGPKTQPAPVLPQRQVQPTVVPQDQIAPSSGEVQPQPVAPIEQPKELTPEEKIIKGLESGNTEDALQGVLEGLMR